MRWRKRTSGTKRQLGKPFPLEDESAQKKKGLLPKIQGRLKGRHKSKYEKDFVNSLKIAIKSKDEKYLVDDSILTEDQMQYLESRGYIKVDPISEDISLTEKGLLYIYNKRILDKAKQPDENNVAISLTDKEKEWMKRKLDS